MNPLTYEITDPCYIGNKTLKFTLMLYSVQVADYPNVWTVASTINKGEAEFIKEIVKKHVDDPDSVSIDKEFLTTNTVVNDEFFKHYNLDDIAIKRQIWEWERDNLGLPWKEEE